MSYQMARTNTKDNMRSYIWVLIFSSKSFLLEEVGVTPLSCFLSGCKVISDLVGSAQSKLLSCLDGICARGWSRNSFSKSRWGQGSVLAPWEFGCTDIASFMSVLSTSWLLYLNIKSVLFLFSSISDFHQKTCSEFNSFISVLFLCFWIPAHIHAARQLYEVWPLRSTLIECL